ncbi:TonB-dependent receptor [Sphingopyxis sp.]|uniref:TonB-dependent receptor n=1 Tax=Sphingopyxis sp. TaxID=1908224 RepID=UPI002630E866|nr:TonB-dependent receptor [Sphingopyxis sp.]MCW0200069.1 TonB-dependent receptor [Sphingopyxis sp.]
MRIQQWRNCVSRTAMVLTICTAAPAFAQETPPAADAPAAQAPAADSGDIVVTAQKREESVQKVPISIAAFSNDMLESASIANVQDLGQVATNFQAARSSSIAAVHVNIRGVGAAGNSLIEPSVAIFQDDIYIPRAGSVLGNFLDVSAVEVLRGPQGTLFGRNASVGALSLHSALPTGDFSGEINGEYGTAARKKLSGNINLPVGDKLSLRFAGMGQWFDGYWHNKLDGRTFGGSDDYAFRGTAKFESGPIEWIVRADYSRMKGDGQNNNDLDPSSVSAAGLASLAAAGLLPDTVFGDRTANTFITADFTDKNWGVNSTLSYELAGGSTLRLVDSYREWRSRQLDGDILFTPRPVVSRVGQYSSNSQSHELQFISPKDEWLGGLLDLVGGLYYFKEDFTLGEAFNMNSQYCTTLVSAAAVAPASRADCEVFRAATGGINASDQRVTQSVSSLAAYGQATFNLAETLSLTLGGRWTQDKKSGTFDQESSLFTRVLRAPEVLTFPKIKESRFTYRISLNYEPIDDVMLFANYSTGYKSGGFSSSGGPVSQSVVDPNGNLVSTKRLFDQETVKDYEFGIKARWLDRALTTNLTFYRMDIAGYQDKSYDGAGFTIRNAGNLRQQGFEFDTIIAPARWLKFNASLAYLDSNFTNFPLAAGLPGCAKNGAGVIPVVCRGLPNQGQTQDLKGAPATFSPEWSGSFGVDFSGDIGSSGLNWAFNTNLSLISDQSIGTTTDNNPQLVEDGYVLVGARFTLNGPDDRWSVSVYGRNLTGTSYSYAAVYQPLGGPLGLNNGVFPGSTAVRRAEGDPRTYGVSATFRF